MATITSNATGGGNWDAGASWAGGAAPSDGDAVVIAAGDTITMNANLSSWTTGVAGITITSHATTPGKLVFKYDADGTYYLKVKAGTNIVGTNAAAKGQLIANGGGTLASTTDLAVGRKVTIDLLGTTAGYIDCTYLDVNLRCTEPTNKYVTTYGSVWTATFAASTDKWTLASGPSTSTYPVNGTPVVLIADAGASIPAEFTAGTTYWVVGKSAATIQLAASYGGAAITSESDSSGTIYLGMGAYTLSSVSGDTFTWNGSVSNTLVMAFKCSDPPAPASEYIPFTVASVSGLTSYLNWSTSIRWTPSDAGSGSIKAYYGTHGAGATPVFQTLEDVTGDGQWVAGARVSYNNAGGTQLDTIASTSATWIKTTTTGPGASAVPLCRLYLLDRNINILSASTTISAPVVKSPNANCYFKCSITRQYATANKMFDAGSGYTIGGGIYHGGYNQVSGGTGMVIDNAIFAQSTSAMDSFTLASVTDSLIIGAVSACTSSYFNNCEIAYSYYGETGSLNVLESCVIRGNTQSISAKACTYISCVFVGGSQLANASSNANLLQGCQVYAYAILNNGAFLETVGSTTVIRAVSSLAAGGCSLKVTGGTVTELGATPMDGPDNCIFTGINAVVTPTKYAYSTFVAGPKVTATFWDTPSDGYIGYYDVGGKTVSAEYASGTHGTTPVTPPFCVHVTTTENGATTPTWIKHNLKVPLWCNTDQSLEVVVYAKQVATGFDDRAAFSLELADGTVAETLTVADNTDWQTLTLNTATLDHDQPVTLNLNVRGQSKVLYWFYVVTPPATEGGGGRPEIRGSNL